MRGKITTMPRSGRQGLAGCYVNCVIGWFGWFG